jgi:hypothetical protein
MQWVVRCFARLQIWKIRAGIAEAKRAIEARKHVSRTLGTCRLREAWGDAQIVSSSDEKYAFTMLRNTVTLCVHLEQVNTVSS